MATNTRTASEKKQGVKKGIDSTNGMVDKLPDYEITDEEADALLNEAYSINQRLKEELQEQLDNASHRESESAQASHTGYGLNNTNRSQVQFGSRESLSGTLPPIVGSSGQFSAKAYGGRRTYPSTSQVSNSPSVYHARLQFNSPDTVTSRSPSQMGPQLARESTSLWNTSQQWTDKFTYT